MGLRKYSHHLPFLHSLKKVSVPIIMCCAYNLHYYAVEVEEHKKQSAYHSLLQSSIHSDVSDSLSEGIIIIDAAHGHS